MADTKLANLTASGALTGTELFYSDNGSADVKVTATQIHDFIVGSGSVSVASGKTLTVSNSLTLAGTDGKTLTVSNNLTLAGTDGSTLNIGAGGTLGTAAFVNTGTSGGTVPLLNAANTFGASQTFSPAANTQALVASGYSLTGADAHALLDLSGTWNTSGNPTGVKLNLTQTAAGTSSKFADFQIGGTSKINFQTGGTTPLPMVCVASQNTGGFQLINGSDAGVTNNFEYLQTYFSGNVAIIESNKVGTGTARTVRMKVGATAVADFSSLPIVLPATATPAGGATGTGLQLGSTSNFGIFFGSGAPTLSAAQGSLYIRSDGSATNNRGYINTDGGTTWTALTTAA